MIIIRTMTPFDMQSIKLCFLLYYNKMKKSNVCISTISNKLSYDSTSFILNKEGIERRYLNEIY